MKPNNNKRKMDQADDDIIPGTPQEKQFKKKQRKKSAKCLDGLECDDLLAGIDFSEDIVPALNNPSPNEDSHQNLNELLNGIDFFDDFDNEDFQVSFIILSKNTNL